MRGPNSVLSNTRKSEGLAQLCFMDNYPIKHVVVLMLENNSFDRMLGCFHPKVRGVDAANPRVNTDVNGQPYKQAPTTTTSVDPDPMHEVENVLLQIEQKQADDVPLPVPSFLTRIKQCIARLLSRHRRLMPMAREYQGKFVLDYSRAWKDTSKAQRREIMGYYPKGMLYALHSLAEEFTICDQWFSSVPGPTWTNRFFVHSGTSLGWVKMPSLTHDYENMHDYSQETIYDMLEKKGKTWRIYCGDIPQSWALSRMWIPPFLHHYRLMHRFEQDVKAPEADFPAYCFIEPAYYFPHPNDDHPHHNIMNGQKLIADVYNAIRQKEALWNSTLLVILYDEHGGFFDHLEPLSATPPDEHQQENFAFDRFGVRVPALLVSPWVDKGGVCEEKFDHTSLLRYLIEKWELGDLERLGQRVANAKSIKVALKDTPQPATLGMVPIPHELVVAAAPKNVEELNNHQQAILVLTERMRAPEIRIMPTAAADASSRVDAAKEKARRLIEGNDQ
jgi:phospholipase C